MTKKVPISIKNPHKSKDPFHPLYWRTGLVPADIIRLINEVGREPVEAVLRAVNMLPPGFELPTAE